MLGPMGGLLLLEGAMEGMEGAMCGDPLTHLHRP
jgi:hypothetical protein